MEIIVNNDNSFEEISLVSLLKAVCHNLDCTKEEMMSHRKNAGIVYKRHVMYYLAHKYNSSSLTMVGKFMNRDHTSIIHGYRKIERTLEGSDGFEDVIDQIVSDARIIDKNQADEVMEAAYKQRNEFERRKKLKSDKIKRNQDIISKSDGEFRIVNIDGKVWCVPKAARVNA